VGAVWRKSMRSDSNGGQCVEVKSLEGWRCRAAGFSRPRGRRGRLGGLGWRGADLQPGQVEDLPVAGLDPGVIIIREARGRPLHAEVGV
jgi:hypothetical protein